MFCVSCKFRRARTWSHLYWTQVDIFFRFLVDILFLQSHTTIKQRQLFTLEFAKVQGAKFILQSTAA
jgi:hypothetical protein